MNALLRALLGYGEPAPDAPPISPIENNPVGWSSTRAPDILTNPSPTVSPLVSAMLMTPEQKIGRFWNAANRQAKPAYTGADMAQLTAAGNEGLDAALGWTGMTTPIRAYHGSPHTFDRFDLSKIGTGEGAQAYGHGLYFAGNEGVARSYKEALGGMKWDFQPSTSAERNAVAAAQRYLADAGWDDATGVMQALRDSAPEVVDDFAKMVASGRATAAPQGSMYEVSLRTSPERLLDWDKPLSQQPAAVREALGPALGRRASDIEAILKSGVEASDPMISRQLQNPEVAQAFRGAGVDGIQYLDAGSRAAGDGSRNYVMFRDDIIDILKRYGLFGLGMMGGAAAQGADQ